MTSSEGRKLPNCELCYGEAHVVEHWSLQPRANKWLRPANIHLSGGKFDWCNPIPNISNFSSLLVEGISRWPHKTKENLSMYLNMRGSHAEEISISLVHQNTISALKGYENEVESKENYQQWFCSISAPNSWCLSNPKENSKLNRMI